MTETVKSLNYTKSILQTIPNNDTMEVVTQTNAVKSPTDSLKHIASFCFCKFSSAFSGNPVNQPEALFIFPDLTDADGAGQQSASVCAVNRYKLA